MTTPPRDVLKWLQSLELEFNVGNPRWDISNGYLVAEICTLYFPKMISIHWFENRSSLKIKQYNWAMLRDFFRRCRARISDKLIQATVHCKNDAANLVLR